MKRESHGTLDQLVVRLKTNLRRYKEEFGVELLERTRARTPVLSGALRGGWGFVQKKESIEIYNTKDYAGYVEFGTSRMAPRAMLRTSLSEAQEISDIALKKSGVIK